METLGEVARWGGLSDPPSSLGTPHFYSSSAVRPLSPAGCTVSIFLLLRTAWDIEVHDAQLMHVQ